jgi:alkylhydroperoxidase family enzyme
MPSTSTSGSQGRGHRRLRRPHEAVREEEARRRVPDNGYVYFHHKPVLKAILSFEGKVEKWDRLDANLKSYAQLASAGVIGCSWCLDFGYFMAHNDGLDLAKVREVPRWRESDVFTPLERDVIEYAEAMTRTAADRDRRDGAAPGRRSSARRPWSS